MPKKTHCFDRNKSEYMTIINTKKGQRILGQDSSSSNSSNSSGSSSSSSNSSNTNSSSSGSYNYEMRVYGNIDGKPYYNFSDYKAAAADKADRTFNGYTFPTIEARKEEEAHWFDGHRYNTKEQAYMAEVQVYMERKEEEAHWFDGHRYDTKEQAEAAHWFNGVRYNSVKEIDAAKIRKEIKDINNQKKDIPSASSSMRPKVDPVVQNPVIASSNNSQTYPYNTFEEWANAHKNNFRIFFKSLKTGVEICFTDKYGLKDNNNYDSFFKELSIETFKETLKTALSYIPKVGVPIKYYNIEQDLKEAEIGGFEKMSKHISEVLNAAGSKNFTLSEANESNKKLDETLSLEIKKAKQNVVIKNVN